MVVWVLGGVCGSVIICCCAGVHSFEHRLGEDLSRIHCSIGLNIWVCWGTEFVRLQLRIGKGEQPRGQTKREGAVRALGDSLPVCTAGSWSGGREGSSAELWVWANRVLGTVGIVGIEFFFSLLEFLFLQIIVV